jgi:hypothetical protein
MSTGLHVAKEARSARKTAGPSVHDGLATPILPNHLAPGYESNTSFQASSILRPPDASHN